MPRWAAVAAAAIFAGKIAWELGTGTALAAGELTPGVGVSTEAHLLGAAAGVACALARTAHRSWRPRLSPGS